MSIYGMLLCSMGKANYSASEKKLNCKQQQQLVCGFEVYSGSQYIIITKSSQFFDSQSKIEVYLTLKALRGPPLMSKIVWC